MTKTDVGWPRQSADRPGQDDAEALAVQDLGTDSRNVRHDAPRAALECTTVSALNPRANAGRSEWDALVQELGGNFMQSWAWGELQRGHGFRVERVHVEGRHGTGLAQLFFRPRGPVSVAFLPHGPLVSGDAAAVARELFAVIDRVCARHRALRLTIQPLVPLLLEHTPEAAAVTLGTRPTYWCPSRTVVVPLRDDQALLAQMKPETRRKIRRAQRQGVEVQRWVPDDQALATYYGLHQDTAHRNGFDVESRSYYEDFLRAFGDHAVLLFAVVDGAVATGMIGVRFGAEAAYWKGASSTSQRVRGATDYLQFEAMRWARDHGCARYDLWGIDWGTQAEKRVPVTEGDVQGSSDDAWLGVASFKSGFGGEVVAFPPALERSYHSLLNQVSGHAGMLGLYKLWQRANRRPRGSFLERTRRTANDERVGT